MWKHSFKHEGKLIRFENGTWDGVEHVYVDDESVSSKFSVMGTSHEFMVGDERCTLIVKVSALTMIDVYLSFYADKRLIFNDYHIRPTGFGKSLSLDFYGHKYKGIKHLKLYDIDEAIEDLKKAIEQSPSDYDTHFHLAICYSLKEEEALGIEHLQLFLDNEEEGNKRAIEEDRLAFLRMSNKIDLLKA